MLSRLQQAYNYIYLSRRIDMYILYIELRHQHHVIWNVN